MLYNKLLKPALFKMDAEKAHHVIMNAMSAAPRIPGALSLLHALYGTDKTTGLGTSVWNIPFNHPIGLAAGLDKNAQAVEAFSTIGFSFMEVGTVTPKPQRGNDKPRMFRLPSDAGLINRMGFNNLGAEAMVENLKKVDNIKIPLAVNVGKNKNTPNDAAVEDYLYCVRQLYSYGELFVVNISSPNTPGLRELQHGKELEELLKAVITEMKEQDKIHQEGVKPVLVKIAPDLTEKELYSMLKHIVDSGAAGFIAANTTISRDGLTHRNAMENGGLSGKPLNQRSTELIRFIYRETDGKLPIVGSGGVFSAQDAYDKIKAGASLVEIYTSLIYHGPMIIKQIVRGLETLMKQDGWTNIKQAVGKDAYLR